MKKNLNTVKNDDTDESKIRRRVMLAVILVIMILSLIMSCSCSSNFWGVIGNIFRNGSEIDITDKPTDEVVKNQNLKFSLDELEISLSDTKAKMSFYYEGIKPTEYTCTTSDASIASCYVEDDYVVINPYKTGEVTIYLQTKTNGKTYEASSKVIILDSDRNITLSSIEGTINLAYTNKKNVTYTLNGIKGTPTVTSSDESVATAVAENGILKITAFKTGNVNLTLKLNYNGIDYEVVYSLKVTNQKTSGGNSTSAQDKDSTLVSLTSNKGELNFKPNILSYDLGVSWITGSITLTAKANNGSLEYSYKRADKASFETVKSLKNLKLKSGENVVLITVTAKDGSKTVYRVNINKAAGNYIKNIESNDISLNFNKNTLEYIVETDKDKISLSVTPDNKDEVITYTYRGQAVSNLNDLTLLPGMNVIEVIATHDDETRTYTIRINKKEAEIDEPNSELGSLTDSLGQIAFNPNVHEYHMNVSSDTNQITISASAASEDATITIKYGNTPITGNNLNNVVIDNLKEGKNIVEIVVKNGKNETPYTIIIDKEATPVVPPLLTGITAPGLDDFDPNKFDGYVIDVGTQDTLLMSMTANDGSTIEYCYNDACSKDDWTKGSSIKASNLRVGNNTIKIRVTKGNLSNTYTINVKRNESASLSNIAELSEAVVNGTKLNFDAENKSSITVEATGDITLTAIAKNNGSVSIDAIKEEINAIAPGKSKEITITVTSEDKTNTKDYKVTITRKDSSVEPPEPDDSYTIKFTSVPDCEIGSNLCQIEYQITNQDGVDVTASYTGTISASLGNMNISTSTKGILQFKPNMTYPTTLELSLVVNPGTTIKTTVKFIKKTYTLYAETAKQYFNVEDNKDAVSSIIMYTDLFDTKKLSNVESQNGILKLCAKDQKDVCITVSVQPEYASLVKLKYAEHDRDDSRYLPITVIVSQTELDKLNTIPSPVITISGNVLGSPITPTKNGTVTLDISRTYTLTLNAGDGVFQLEGTDKDKKIKEFPVKKGETFYLTSVDIPYIIGGSTGSSACPTITKVFDHYETANCTSDSCKYTDSIEINKSETLVAKYREVQEGDITTPTKTFWLSLDNASEDNSLFYNKDNDKNTNQSDLLVDNATNQKLIYPGASGSYVMSITNTMSNPITITGLILEENTICVESGCINMGFQVNSGSGNTPETGTSITHLGDNTVNVINKADDAKKYSILNSLSTTPSLKITKTRDLSTNTGTNRADLTFNKDTNDNTTLAPNDFIEITLHWKWVDFDDDKEHDALDTAIGTKVAEKGQKNTYELKVGIKYVDKCN